MKIAIIGTGMVGQSIGNALLALGHNVMMGSRDAQNPNALDWANGKANASVGTFAQAASFGDVAFNCLKGEFCVPVVTSIKQELSGKILVDISNPLDFSKGMPPTLFVVNDRSLGEDIQDAVPDTHVVKTLNTLTASLMVNPKGLAEGNHDIFICGNNAAAKATVVSILNSFGWDTKRIHDLGDITNARGTEQVLPLWIRLYGHFQSPMFQFSIVR